MKMNSCNSRIYNKKAYKLFFWTMANQSRLEILNALREGEKNVSEICQKTKFEQSMVSHNLKILEFHGMIFKEKKGKFSNYALNKKTITPLLDLIDSHMEEYCCKIARGEL